MSAFSLATSPINSAAIVTQLDSPSVGAMAMFEGRVRNHHQGRVVSGLYYQAYPELAISEGQRILTLAMRRYDIAGVRCVHRIGDLVVGDMAVLVVVTATHRDAAFGACRYVIDEVKNHVPIWKQEHLSDGSSLWQHPFVRGEQLSA